MAVKQQVARADDVGLRQRTTIAKARWRFGHRRLHVCSTAVAVWYHGKLFRFYLKASSRSAAALAVSEPRGGHPWVDPRQRSAVAGFRVGSAHGRPSLPYPDRVDAPQMSLHWWPTAPLGHLDGLRYAENPRELPAIIQLRKASSAGVNSGLAKNLWAKSSFALRCFVRIEAIIEKLGSCFPFWGEGIFVYCVSWRGLRSCANAGEFEVAPATTPIQFRPTSRRHRSPLWRLSTRYRLALLMPVRKAAPTIKCY